jgi:GT2 family glycosyltransferase
VATRIAVLTVTYNSGQVLPDFLRSLSAQQGAEFHLYAVDNASADDTVARLRAWQQERPQFVTVVANSANVGAAEGNNQAIQAALADRHDLLLLMNNDVVFGADLLAQLAAGLAEHNADIACPRITYFDRPGILWCAGGEFQPRAGYRTVHFGQGEADGANYDAPRRVTYAPTTCLLMTRRAIETVGLLDPTYFAYSEDADFMWRAQRAGLQAWYVPSAKVAHKVSSLAGHQSPFADRYGTRNRIYFLRKNVGGARAAFWAQVYRVYLFLRWLARLDSTARLRVKLAAWREGWQMPLPAK